MKSTKKPTYEELEKLIDKLKLDDKLKKIENRFKTLLKAPKDRISIHDTSGKYLYYNGPTYYTKTPEDIVGKMPNDLFDKDVSDILLEAFKKVAKTGESETVEIFLDWLGEKRWVSQHIYAVKNTDGEVTEMVKICKNIHTRKLAEQEIEIQNKALLKSEKAYRDAVEASSDLITVFDSTGKIVFANRASKKFFGLAPKECLGKFIFDFIPPEDKAYTQTKLLEWATSEINNFIFENRKISVSGAVLETEWSINIERKGKKITKITSIIRDITKQNSIHQKLINANKEREQFFNFFKFSPNIKVITDLKGTFKLVNPATIKLFGYSEEELTSRPFIDFIHPDDKLSTLKEIKKGVKHGFPTNFENRCLSKNNECFLLSWSTFFSKKEGIIYASARNITNQRLIETELIKAKKHTEESEERFRLLMQNMGVGIVVHAPDTSIILNNAKASEILRLSNDQLRGKKAMDPAWQFLKPDKSPLPFNEYPVNKIKASKKSIKNKVFGISLEDKEDVYWVTVNGYPELNSAGNITEIVISFIDITEQIRVEEEKLSAILQLNDSKQRLNEAQKVAHIGSWLFDLQSQKIEWSNETFQIWGFDPSKDAPQFETVINQIHSEDKELFTNAVNKAIKLGIPYDIEHRIDLQDGEQKIIRATCKPQLNSAGKVVSLAGTSQDITSQKLFEMDQVKHERLKAMGEMSSSIAHDFNNSLQQMTGNLEIIKFEKGFSNTTLERLHNLETIINDVADRVSALQKHGDTKNDHKNSQLIDFNTLIEESLSQSRPLWKDDMEKKGLRVTITTDFQSIPKFIGNKGELKSTFYNLIKNSIEAMPEGGAIMIKTSTKAKQVFATFTDTGIGMDEETKTKVFEPFFTTKGFELGRGLGMSGVYNTIKKYNGDITVKSAGVSEGTTFEIAFPVSHQEEEPVISNTEQKDKTSFTILWVDDDTAITEDVSELMGLMGHTCAIANNGKNALAHLNKNQCDIVFTDIGMVDMNGWELIAAIRKDFGSKIKIVTVSGWGIDDKTKEEHAIDFVLQKPYTVEKLEKLLLDL